MCVPMARWGSALNAKHKLLSNLSQDNEKNGVRRFQILERLSSRYVRRIPGCTERI